MGRLFSFGQFVARLRRAESKSKALSFDSGLTPSAQDDNVICVSS